MRTKQSPFRAARVPLRRGSQVAIAVQQQAKQATLPTQERPGRQGDGTMLSWAIGMAIASPVRCVSRGQSRSGDIWPESPYRKRQTQDRNINAVQAITSSVGSSPFLASSSSSLSLASSLACAPLQPFPSQQPPLLAHQYPTPPPRLHRGNLTSSP